MSNTHSIAEITSGGGSRHEITSKSLVHCFCHTTLSFFKKTEENEVEWTWKALVSKAELLAVAETGVAVFWLGWTRPKEGTTLTLTAFGSSVKRSLISASAPPPPRHHHLHRKKKKEEENIFGFSEVSILPSLIVQTDTYYRLISSLDQ